MAKLAFKLCICFFIIQAIKLVEHGGSGGHPEHWDLSLYEGDKLRKDCYVAAAAKRDVTSFDGLLSFYCLTPMETHSNL